MHFLTALIVGIFFTFAWCEAQSPAINTPGLCTNISLSYPGWEVTALVLTNHRIDFRLVNNADADIRTSCSGDSTVSPPGYQECEDKQTRFTYKEQSSVLAINQTWTCNDSNLTFIGTGTTTLPCPPNTTTCATPNTNPQPIRASLLAPIPITPQPLPFPPSATTPNCTHRSLAPTFEITHLHYQRLDLGPPCGPVSGTCSGTSLYYGEIKFTLRNTATNDTRACAAQTLGLSDLQAMPRDWLACDAGLVFINPVPADPPPDFETRTYFWFDHAANMLLVRQEWYCGDLGGREEYGFVAEVEVSPALDPGVDYVGNLTVPGVGVDAGAPVLVVEGEVVRERLPPYSLGRPRVFEPSCTVTSLVKRSKMFPIQDFWFGMYWTGAGVRTGHVWMFVTNEVFNTQLNFESEGTAMVPGVDGVSNPDVWYGCVGGNSAAPPVTGLLNCSFAFDRTANRLSVREDWVCADKDSENPILFTAIGSGVVDMDDSLCEISDDEPDNRYCPGPGHFNIDITDYSWREALPVYFYNRTINLGFPKGLVRTRC
ncbi:hypothetical protein F5144DRAFT_619364 [Chaetomium tenue]|uniref:Uncharacterized protein n=1 Tax=Chaetomium tenue TaxID=1854479 RepID=A0ACB7PAH4_9PEZI|nr:hypothetical protein F5144DRAFT_619364 [Chaetomium globosum]